jgi:hypothetical protein
MTTDVAKIDKKSRRGYLTHSVSKTICDLRLSALHQVCMVIPTQALCVIACVLGLWTSALAQQPIAPVDFRPFVDGRNWIVRQPLVYTIGVSKDTITVPPGFVTDLASIPQVCMYMCVPWG